jgi:hypothetical protein
MCDGKQIKIKQDKFIKKEEPTNIGSNHVMWFFDFVLSCKIQLRGYFNLFLKSKSKNPNPQKNINK